MKANLYDPDAHRKNKIRHAKYKRFARATKVTTYNIFDLPPDHELRRKYGLNETMPIEGGANDENRVNR